MIPNLIDTHFHLDFYKNHKDIYTQINELQQYTLCMTNSPGVYLACKKLYPETKYLKFALGFHPQQESFRKQDFNEFLRLVDYSNYVGEIGLDFLQKDEGLQHKQSRCFENIVEICSRKNKLMSIHLRKSENVAVHILQKYNPQKCIIHWFSGSEEQLEQLIDLGCYFSINANMVNNKKTCKNLYMIPKTKILIESDGPFSKVDGKKYSVEFLYRIYEEIARFYNEPDMINIVYSNFKDILMK